MPTADQVLGSKNRSLIQHQHKQRFFLERTLFEADQVLRLVLSKASPLSTQINFNDHNIVSNGMGDAESVSM